MGCAVWRSVQIIRQQSSLSTGLCRPLTQSVDGRLGNLQTPRRTDNEIGLCLDRRLPFDPCSLFDLTGKLSHMPCHLVYCGNPMCYYWTIKWFYVGDCLLAFHIPHTPKTSEFVFVFGGWFTGVMLVSLSKISSVTRITTHFVAAAFQQLPAN